MALGSKEREILTRALRSVPGATNVTAVIFGSHARGDAGFGSDIDVGLRSKDDAPLPPGLLADIQEALENSPLQQRVEVVDLARTSLKFRNEALSHTIAV